MTTVVRETMRPADEGRRRDSCASRDAVSPIESEPPRRTLSHTRRNSRALSSAAEAIPTPSTDTERTPPRSPASGDYTAVPTNEDQNSVKYQDEAVIGRRHRGCWEAWQDSTWNLEMLSLFSATASTIAVCVILALSNNRPLQDWQLPIKPNSLISVFSTLAKTALILPLASVISQMKWIWFEEPRNLAHFQAFDKASRGPWGAMILLWDTKGKAWLTKAACVLTVAALAFEPTAQQVLSFESRETQVHNATSLLSVATNWTSYALMEGMGGESKQVAMQAYLLSAFSPTLRNNEPKFECTAPSCSWENVETLGACSSCSRAPLLASSLERYDNYSFTVSRPPSLTVVPGIKDNLPFPDVVIEPRAYSYQMTALTDPAVHDTSFAKFAAVDASSTTFNTNDTAWVWKEGDTVEYYACRIHPCVQTFSNVTVRNGVYHYDKRADQWLIQGGDDFVYHPERPEDDSNWTIGYTTATRMQSILGNMLDGSIPHIQRWNYQVHSGGFSTGITRYVSENGPDRVMAALSDVISAQMRGEDNAALRNVSGVALEPQTFIVVNWAWMAGPLTMLAATIATLAIAMVRNASRPLRYKDSAVALLGLGLGQAGSTNQPLRGNLVGTHYTAYQAELAASRLTAQLHKDANGEYMFLTR